MPVKLTPVEPITEEPKAEPTEWDIYEANRLKKRKERDDESHAKWEKSCKPV